MRWIQRFEVTGRSGSAYTVALAESGHWGCSCPKWKFAKKGPDGSKPDCHHIDSVRAALPVRVAKLDRIAERQREARNEVPELDMEPGAQVAPLPLVIGARFKHLDFDIQVTA